MLAKNKNAEKSRFHPLNAPPLQCTLKRISIKKNKSNCSKIDKLGNIVAFLFRNSSAVEQWTVNPLVVGSNPTSGDTKI